MMDFNPRTPCGVRLGMAFCQPLPQLISIHAPRVGCDMESWQMVRLVIVFQSTHPVWGATAP